MQPPTSKQLVGALFVMSVQLLTNSLPLQTTCKPGTVEAAAQAVKAEEESAAARSKAEISAALHDAEGAHTTQPRVARWQQYD